jgi:hypothetical protein
VYTLLGCDAKQKFTATFFRDEEKAKKTSSNKQDAKYVAFS